MAKLNVSWSGLGETSVTTGTDADVGKDFSTARAMLDSNSMQTDKPFVVYLTSSDPQSVREQEVVDNTTMMDERISIGAKAFVMIKADGDSITKDHAFYRHLKGKKFPRLVAFSAAGDRVGALEGRTSPSKLFGLMNKAYKRDYKGDLGKTIKDFQKVLTQIDTMDSQKRALDEKELHAKTKRAKNEIVKKRAILAKQEEELRIQEEKILEFRRRTA